LTVRATYEEARQDALKAISLAPDLAEAHFALAYYFEMGQLGRKEASIAIARRAVLLDPLNRSAHSSL
jgi:tetratricopeptide (TPR) repeat protein